MTWANSDIEELANLETELVRRSADLDDIRRRAGRLPYTAATLKVFNDMSEIVATLDSFVELLTKEESIQRTVQRTERVITVRLTQGKIHYE